MSAYVYPLGANVINTTYSLIKFSFYCIANEGNQENFLGFM